jgi:hypothetical protein
VAHRIAFLALYMPILRKEVHGYVDLWNLHSIRRQSNRPNAVIGKPEVNYLWPKDGVKHYGRKIDSIIVKGLENEYADYGELVHPLLYSS